MQIGAASTGMVFLMISQPVRHIQKDDRTFSKKGKASKRTRPQFHRACSQKEPLAAFTTFLRERGTSHGDPVIVLSRLFELLCDATTHKVPAKNQSTKKRRIRVLFAKPCQALSNTFSCASKTSAYSNNEAIIFDICVAQRSP